jgi:hypothetical protein
MKRFALMVTIAAAASFGGAASASCAGGGQFFHGHIEFGATVIDGTGWGNALGTMGPAQACDNGTAGPAAQQASLTIRVGGVVVCDMAPADIRYGNDPFGFGGGFHGNVAAPCGGDISFDTITGTPSADPGDFAQDGMGGHGGIRKSANGGGTYWIGENKSTVPDGAAAWLLYGAKATAN